MKHSKYKGVLGWFYNYSSGNAIYKLWGEKYIIPKNYIESNGIQSSLIYN